MTPRNFYDHLGPFEYSYGSGAIEFLDRLCNVDPVFALCKVQFEAIIDNDFESGDIVVSQPIIIRRIEVRTYDDQFDLAFYYLKKGSTIECNRIEFKDAWRKW